MSFPMITDRTFCYAPYEHSHHEFMFSGKSYACTGEFFPRHVNQQILFPEECWPPRTEPYKTSKGTWDQGVLFDREKIPKENLDRADELANWWMTQSAKETANLVPKAISYGSIDLDIMGDAMMLLMPKLEGVVAKQELALAFYLLGKVSRIFGALEQGVAPAADSWEDSSIYAKMAMRVRETGKW